MFQHFKKQFVKDYLLALKDKHSIQVKTTVMPLAKLYSNILQSNCQQIFISITGDEFLLES